MFVFNILENFMTSVISRGPTSVSSQLPMAGEAIATANQTAAIGDRFDGVIAGEALQATLASNATSTSCLLYTSDAADE